MLRMWNMQNVYITATPAGHGEVNNNTTHKSTYVHVPWWSCQQSRRRAGLWRWPDTLHCSRDVPMSVHMSYVEDSIPGKRERYTYIYVYDAVKSCMMYRNKPRVMKIPHYYSGFNWQTNHSIPIEVSFVRQASKALTAISIRHVVYEHSTRCWTHMIEYIVNRTIRLWTPNICSYVCTWKRDIHVYIYIYIYI